MFRTFTILLLLACAVLAQTNPNGGCPMDTCQWDESCFQCHYPVVTCYPGEPVAACLDCYTPCVGLTRLSPEKQSRARQRSAYLASHPLTDAGVAWQTMMSSLIHVSRPQIRTGLPQGHPAIPIQVTRRDCAAKRLKFMEVAILREGK